jgi:hypothetical protein
MKNINKNDALMCTLKHDGNNITKLDKNTYHYSNGLLTGIDMYIYDDEYDVITITHKFKDDKHIFTVKDSTSTCEHVYRNDDIVKLDLYNIDINNKPIHTCYYYYKISEY